MKERNYIPQKAKIVERRPLAKDIVSLTLKPLGKSRFNFTPGRFVMLSVAGFGEIPVGITTSPHEKGILGVAIRSVGMVSQKICSLREGDEIGFSGPFGNGFPMNKIKDKDVVIVAGGIGLFPLRSLIRHIGLNKKIVKSLTILNGAKTPEDLLFTDEYKNWEKFAKVHLTVDSCDSTWTKCVGNITKLFNLAEVKKGSVMIVCGPPVMFRAVCDYYGGKRVAESDLYLLLERRMKCGIGKCQHCTCGKLYVCLDGPVFAYDRIKYIDEAFA